MQLCYTMYKYMYLKHWSIQFSPFEIQVSINGWGWISTNHVTYILKQKDFDIPAIVNEFINNLNIQGDLEQSVPLCESSSF